MSAVRKVVVGGEGQGVPAASIKSTRMGTLQAIMAHLTELQYDDSSRREVGWLTLRTRGGQWEIVVKDPDSCSSLSATAPLLDDALTAMEALLGSSRAPWQPDPFLQKRKPNGRR